VTGAERMSRGLSVDTTQKLNYTEDHLFLVIFFVQCIRFFNFPNFMCLFVYHTVLFFFLFIHLHFHEFMYLCCIICTFVTY